MHVRDTNGMRAQTSHGQLLLKKANQFTSFLHRERSALICRLGSFQKSSPRSRLALAPSAATRVDHGWKDLIVTAGVAGMMIEFQEDAS